MNQHLLLFTFDLLSLTFTPQFDPLNHILLDQPAPGTFRVIKNGQNLRNLFHLFEKMQFTLVCYSAKNYVQTMNILSKVNENLRWIYTNVDKQKLPFLRPNRAHLCDIDDKFRIIEYGQGFSSSEAKEQIRIAICSAMKVGFEESKQAFILFENNTQQISKLKQNGYHNIFSSIPENEAAMSSLISELQKITHTKQEKLKTQFDQFVQNCNQFDFKFAHQISSFFYLERKKNVAPPVSLGLSKQSPLIFRHPKSMSISPQVFRWSGDKQIYLGRAEVTNKIGGEIEYQIQENKILQSCIYQTLSQIQSHSDGEDLFLSKYLCLPMQLSQFTMRHSLIKAYNKNKAYFIVQPYLKNLKSVAQSFSSNKNEQQALLLMKSAQFNGKKVKGLGNLLAVSMLCGQNFRQKLFLETVSFIQIKLANSSTINCCRTNICQNFIKQQIKVTQLFELQLVRNSNTRVKIEQLHESIIQQIKQTIQLFCQSYPIILAIIKSEIWRFDKSDQIKIIENNMNALKIQKGEKLALFQVDIRHKMKINRINSRLLKYLIASSPDQRFQYFSEQIPVQKVNKFGYGLDPENVYVQRMKDSENFIIFGQCVPIVSLIKWIKSMNHSIQIVYLSLLTDKPQAYIKQVKLAKSQRKSVMFMIDHCEIEEAGGQLEEGKSITDSNWGMKTIFIYRLKHGSQKKLAYLADGLTSGDSHYSVVQNKLLNSYEQTFKTIFQVIQKQELNSNEFEVYAAAIKMYIERKFYQFGKTIGLTHVSQLFEKLRTLVRFISCKINRIVTIIKDKQFNFTNSASQDSQGTLNSSEHNGLTSSRSVQSQNNVGLQHLKNVPKAQLLLYCLPIHISNQRVWLIHDIHQFLSAYYLHEQIMNEKWQGNLEGQQAKSFLLWFPRMKNKKAIEKNLIKMLDRFAMEEYKKQNKTQIMGSNSKLNDCLQLLKKIGSQFIFCKLQNMFHFDSNVLDMIPVSSGELVIVTEQSKIFKISKTQNFQEKKECWNMMEVLSAKTNLVSGFEKYLYAGIDCKTDKDSQQVNVHFLARSENSKCIKIDKNSIKKKSVSRVKNEVNQKEDIIFIDNIPLILENGIVSCTIIQSMFAVLITASGELVVGKIVENAITKEQQMILSNKSSIFKISEADCLMLQGDKEQGQIILNSDAKIKVISKLRSNGNIGIMVIINNVIMNTIKQDEKAQHKLFNKESAVLLIGFVIQIAANHHFEVQNMSKTILLTPFGTIDIGINYITEQDSQDSGFVRAQAFENITNALLVWDVQIRKQSEQICIVEKPNMKFYRIQNDPAGVYYFANYLFVASKFNFLKRMSLPKSQQELCI